MPRKATVWTDVITQGLQDGLLPESGRKRHGKRKKSNKGPEARLLSSCLDYLKKLGLFCWRNNTGGTKVNGRFMRFGQKGSPDIIGCIHGVFVGIEVKAPGGKLSGFQEAWHAQARHHGAMVTVVRSLDELIEFIERVLRAMGRA